MRAAQPNSLRGESEPPPPAASTGLRDAGGADTAASQSATAAPAAPADAQEWRPGRPADRSVTGAAITVSPALSWTPPGAASPSIGAETTAAAVSGASRRSRGVLLQCGAPAAIVAISLGVALAIAGVFSSSPSDHPRAAASRNITPLRVSAAGGETPAAKPPDHRPRATRRTHRASKPAASKHVGTRSAAKPAAPATSPAPSVARRVVVVSLPTATGSPHVPVPAPAPPHRTGPTTQPVSTPHRLSATRPTQRSGGPGRQPTGG
jgi:hypothetical protein